MLSKAESDALRQILDRHDDVLDQFEKDLLQQILRRYGS